MNRVRASFAPAGFKRILVFVAADIAVAILVPTDDGSSVSGARADPFGPA
jgi:hypothetical protein